MRDVSEIEPLEASDRRTAELLAACCESFAEVRLTVTGACMEPALAEGSRVVLARTPAVFGDVVLARAADGVRLHRVIWSAAGRVRTKGDRSPRWDAGVSRASILATVVARDGDARSVRDRGRALVSLWRGVVARLQEIVPGRARE